MPWDSIVAAGSEFVVGAKPSQTSHGVPNPFGRGASAFEPNTQIYDPSNDPLMAGSRKQVTGQSELDKQAADKLAASQAPSAPPTANAGDVGAPVANGSVLSFINAAKQLLGKPYVWGGTTINGTDCSGLLFFAFNQAGIKMPRYRASDYGKMGQQVTADKALPGDLVYWNEPGDVDHIGIYLGNGLVLNSPHTGTVTQIDRVWGAPTYRRVINDSNFGTMLSGPGVPTTSYAGQSASSLFTGPQAQQVPLGIGIRSTTPALEERLPTNGFKVRAE